MRTGIHLEATAYPGSDIKRAIVELTALARRLHIDVWCTMNGVRVLAKPSTEPDELYKAWESAMDSGRPAGSRIASTP